VSLTGELYLSGLWPPFSDAVRYLKAWCDYLSLNAQIVSGYRSPAEQAADYALGRTPQEVIDRVKKYGQGGAVTDAPPGYSAHNYGLAVDVEGPDQANVLQLAKQLGFGTVSWDPAHIEWPGWRGLVGV
jgi:LAS superfamily LD-carboxypeptidase LdcB